MEYSASLNNSSSQWPDELQPKEPLPLSIFLLMPFLVGAVAVQAMPGFNYLVIGLGVICTVVFLLASIIEGFFVPTELKFLIAFACWATLGIFVAKIPEFVITVLRTLAQMVIMALVVSYYARNTRCVSWLFFAVLTGILIIAVSAVITGEFKMAEMEGEEARLAGIALNANAFAIAVTYGVAILLYYFKIARSKTLKLLMMGGVLTAVPFVIASGSRKGFLALAILVFFWFLFNYVKELRQRPSLAIVMFLFVMGFGFYMVHAMRDTVLMQRFTRLEGGTGAQGRLTLIKDGIDITISNPVLGVGLNNFRVHSSLGRPAHNNYVEVFADTGIPGGILYHIIYILILYRLYKISKYPLAPDQKNAVTIFKCLMLLQLFLDLGVVTYFLKIHWIFLAIIIGYSSYLKRNLETAGSQDYDIIEYDHLTLSHSPEE